MNMFEEEYTAPLKGEPLELKFRGPYKFAGETHRHAIDEITGRTVELNDYEALELLGKHGHATASQVRVLREDGRHVFNGPDVPVPRNPVIAGLYVQIRNAYPVLDEATGLRPRIDIFA